MLVSSFLDRRGLMLGYRGTAAMALALLAVTSVQAQDAGQNSTQQNSTVGSPQLRDFSLPGQRTTPPPAPEPEPVPTIPPPATEQPRPTPAPSPAPTPARPAPAREQPRAAPAPTPQRERRKPDLVAEAAPVPSETVAPPVTAPDPVLPQTGALAPPPPAAPAEPTVLEPRPAKSEGGFPWLPLLLAGGVALLGLFGYRRFAASRTEAFAAPAPEPEPVAVPKAAVPAIVPPRPAPAAAPAAPAAPVSIGIKLRPQLELEFKPDKAAATLTDANVQFELKVRNSGNMAARNIRIEARMFNAGAEQDREIGAFFARPAQESSNSTLPAIPPRGEVAFRSTVTMPKDAVREINVQGRRLFIPMVAFNVLYEWGEGKTGQTSMSYIVGREAPTPSEKMGAFRLDLGPRVYRSVGQRQTTLARIV